MVCIPASYTIKYNHLYILYQQKALFFPSHLKKNYTIFPLFNSQNEYHTVNYTYSVKDGSNKCRSEYIPPNTPLWHK